MINNQSSEAINNLNRERGVDFTPVSESIFEGIASINNQGKKLRIDLGQGFPQHFPIITVLNHKGFIPHVSPNGNICLFEDDSVMLKTGMDDQILIDAYDRAVEILESDPKKQTTETFREFIVYWAEKARNAPFVYVNLPEANVHEYQEYEAVCSISKRTIIVSKNKKESIGILKNYIKPEESLGDVRTIPCIRINLRNPALPPMNVDISWKVIRDYILSNSSVAQRRLFKQYLSSRPSHVSRLFLISIPSPYGSQMACVWITSDNPKNESMKNLQHCQVDPIIALRIDPQYMLLRGGAETDLLDKRVLLIGCGSIGGFIADNMCQCGIGTLDILDKDSLSFDNIHRHILGFTDAATRENKADLMKSFLEKKYPYIDIDSLNYVDRSAEAFISDPERLKCYDVIVSATGNPTINLQINDQLHTMVNPPPYVVCFNEPYGIGGHAVAIFAESACLRCLYTDLLTGELTPFQGSFVKDGQSFSKSLSGCAGTFVEYSVLDSQQTAIMTSRMIIDVLKGKTVQSKLVSWIGSSDKLRELGFITSEHYNKLEREGNTLITRFLQPVKRCKTCGR